MRCAQHPTVETELRCGKCDTPICPRCSVQTPVGARCRACADLRRPVIYQLPPLMMARGVGAALGVAVVVGVLWGYLLPHALNYLGFFVLFLAAGYGWLAAEAVGRATNRRRGPVLRAAIIVSCILVYVVHNLFLKAHTLLVQDDILGYLFVIVAAIVGYGYAR